MTGSFTVVSAGSPAPASATAPFDALYRASDDPWGTRSRWYERRKRALLLAALSREHYGTIYEAGSGNGHISVELATRSDRLLASDASAAAVALTAKALRTSVTGGRDVAVECHRLPDDWPDATFDLIVLSELLYFVDDTACAEIAMRARESAGARGEIVACNWLGEIVGWGHSGEDAHRRFGAALAMPRLFEYRDEDFVLTGWGRDARSAAVRDGLR